MRLAVVALALLSVSAPSAALEQPSSSGSWTADARSTWRDADNEPRVQFDLRTDDGDRHWGVGVRSRELANLSPAALSSTADNVQFTWTREAGAFRFTGSFDLGRGSGTYTFAPDPTFVANMAGAGYRNLSTDTLVRFAIIDVTVAHVRGLAQAGYPNLAIDDVVRTRIHHVTPEFVRELALLGYRGVAVDDLVKMRIHNVTTAEMDELRSLGFGGMAVEDLVKFRIHRVTPAFIRSMKDVGYVTLSEDQLVRLRIHNVDAQFVRDARAEGYALQSPSDAVDLAIHGRRWRKRGW